jgi:tRNA A-37 threonylcarbamoyl transferase component Bud32
VPQDDKKTQIGTGTQNRPITGAPQNVTDAGTAAKTEFLDPSVPPANVTPPPQTPPPGLPPPAMGTAPAVTAGYIAALQAQQQHDPLLGQTIGGRYYVQKKLGEGGMGAVYLATHTIIEKQVALKILHGEFARKGDLVERFMQEAKAASKIQHENVIDVSDFGITNEGLVFFAMELLNGHDLHDEVARARIAGQLLPWSRTKKIFLQICAALAAAHRRGIVHRDLKPENVFLVDFLGDPDFVKLLDFGIAKMTEVGEDGRKLTRTGMLFGTPEYMSPEQARGETADHRVDVYAMGCILFQLITTRVPFEAENFMGVLSLHLTEPPPAIPDEVFDRIGAPRALAQVIDKALEKQREQRYQSIDDMANAVRVACGDPPVSRTTEVTRAASVAAPANLTTQRAAVTPPPGGVAAGTAPPAGSTPPVNAAAAGTAVSAVKTQWTGQLVVPTEGAAPGPSRSKTPLLIGAGIVVAGAAIAAALVLKGGNGGGGGTGSGSNPAVVTPGSGSGSAVVAAARDAAVPAPPALPAEVLLTIEANVKGAEIYDFDHKASVGKAPMTFHVEPSHELRHFTVRAPGYIEALVEVVPEQHELKQVVALQRGVGTVNQLPKVDAGVAPPAVDASGQVTVPIDAAVQVVAPIDAGAASKPPDEDDCPPPCLKAFPGSNK